MSETVTIIVQGRLNEAKEKIGEAIDIIRDSLGVDHEEVGRLLTVQAGIYKDQACVFSDVDLVRVPAVFSQGKYEEAKQDIGLAITIKLERLGPTHATVSSSLRVLAAIMTDLVKTHCAARVTTMTKFTLLLSGGIRDSKIHSGKGFSYIGSVSRQSVGHGL